MNEDVGARIRRIHAAIAETIEEDLSTFGAKPLPGGIGTDFRGELTEEQIVNLAHMAIQNVANLGDHLRAWCRRNGEDQRRVDSAIKGSRALKTILDLANNDKHGYPPRGGGHTGRSLRLKSVERALQVTAGPESPQSSVVMSFDGRPPVVTGGLANVVITGEIVDRKGKTVGDLHETLTGAVAAWERLVRELGITL